MMSNNPLKARPFRPLYATEDGARPKAPIRTGPACQERVVVTGVKSTSGDWRLVCIGTGELVIGGLTSEAHAQMEASVDGHGRKKMHFVAYGDPLLVTLLGIHYSTVRACLD
jgi:hypothetical protein